MQPTKKTVTKRIDGEPDTTTVTITNPETNTTARKVISADPLVPVTDTITTQEIGGDFSSDLTHLGEESLNEDLKSLDLEALIYELSAVINDKKVSRPWAATARQ